MEKKKETDYKKIGTCVVNEEGEIIELKKEYFRQGFIFKDEYAFYQEPQSPCYVPEQEEESFYTREDFMTLCNDQEEIAEMIFESVNWQNPETYFEDEFRMGELDICQSCHKIFLSYDVDWCPYCGEKRADS